ncbi:MAG: hypothetical protein A3K59_05420 [Euryarchaeota archaeon RBG_19FT_COMBO_69_17]|nr:MAG: hypothetical protein A3K59_05420 [Euryarchaeota archaeon RBG_19FT_COMBO_69_17]
MAPAASQASASIWKMDPIAYFAIGGFFLFFGLFFGVFFLGTLGQVDFLAWMCLPPTIVPGSIALAYGVVAWRREHALLAFADWAKSQRRIKMDLMAQRIGRTRFDAERLLGEAIDRKLVNGVIDRASDEFVNLDHAGQQLFAGKCPNCGGEFSVWYFPEERFKCPYCEFAVGDAT